MKEQEDKKLYQFKSQISRLFQFFTSFDVATISIATRNMEIEIRSQVVKNVG